MQEQLTTAAAGSEFLKEHEASAVHARAVLAEQCLLHSFSAQYVMAVEE
jgi:hypothetical protein